jgi:hypothetical protein
VKDQSGWFDKACRTKSFRMKDFTYLGVKICISLRVMGTASHLPRRGRRKAEIRGGVYFRGGWLNTRYNAR